jgi:outer membrane protein OmpA-like peptidoglycan-associated protein
MKKVLSILSFVMFAISFGQKDVPFEKDLFKDQKKEFKEALKAYEEGNDLIFVDPYSAWPDYVGALAQYKIAYAFNPNSAELNYNMGLCMQKINKYEMFDYMKKAYELNPLVKDDIGFFLGYSYQLKWDWKNAKKYYNEALGRVSGDNVAAKRKEINKHIQECNNGIELEKTKARVWIDNLGDAINTKHYEYAPVISADEGMLMFTSRRPDTEGGKVDEEDFLKRHFEDVYYSERGENDWGQPTNQLDEINSKAHDATIGLSPDGKTLFIYIDDNKGHGDIFTSAMEGGVWSKPERLNSNINTKHHEPSAALSFDGKRLFFVSDREGGLGQHDIYYSDWDDEKEDWGAAINIGPTINTEYDERGVFIHPDGKTLYFSSGGHNTMGELDLFYTVFEEGKWIAPVNLGPPLNTPGNDIQIVVAGNGRNGYTSSFRSDSKGGQDIYLVTFLGPEKQPMLTGEDNLIASITSPIEEVIIEPVVEIKESSLAILTGKVFDFKTLETLGSTVEVIDNDDNITIVKVETDKLDGKFLLSLPAGKNYGIVVKKEGYLFHSENFTIPEASGFKQYNIDIPLKKVEVGRSIVLRNIFFDLDKYTLRPESKNELERLIKLMNENPTLEIELGGHTDTRGDAKYNQKLSENRAKAVVQYLVKAGIKESRLKYAGYGETQTIVSDAEIAKMKSRTEKEEAHQENRRTEFKILKI